MNKFILTLFLIMLLALYFKVGNIFFVKSNSMCPVICKNDLVLVKNSGLHNGNIYTYRDISGNYITHKLVSISNQGVILKGLNNKHVDPGLISENKILGSVIFVIPVSSFLTALVSLYFSCVVGFLLARAVELLHDKISL